MLKLTFSIPETAERLPISEVVLRIGTPTSTFFERRFNLKEDPQPWNVNMAEWPGCGYSYRVIFEDCVAPDYESPIRSPEADGEIAIDDFGIRLFLTMAIDFAVVKRINVPYLSCDGIRTFVLDAANPAKLLIGGIDYPHGAPLSYGLEYIISDGNYRQSDLISKESLMQVPYPFVQKTTAFKPVGISGPDPSVRKIQLKLNHHEAGSDWEIMGAPRQAVIDKQNPDYWWRYVAVDPDRALMQYSGSIIMTQGLIKPVAPTECKLAVIPIGDTPPYNSVTIVSSSVHWDEYSSVTLEITTDDLPDHARFRFTADSLTEYWGYFSTAPSYWWIAQYELKDGIIVSTPKKDAFAPILTLPSEPGVGQ